MVQNINTEFFVLSVWGIFALIWSGLYLKHAFFHQKLAWSNQKSFNGGLYVSGSLACVTYFFTQEAHTSVLFSILCLGVFLLLGGLSFSLWARLKMGKAWSIHTIEHESENLLTDGPFKYVRHPIYSGQLMMTIGTGLVLNSAWVTWL